jgi:Glycine transporter
MIAAGLDPPLWIELPAVIAGAMAGALFAQKRGLDVIGILALALVSGLGGGIIRDVLLARVPLALRDAWYLWSVAGAALIGAFFAQAANRLHVALLVVDAVALGLFSAIGAQGGLRTDLPIPSAILLGTITGSGGACSATYWSARPRRGCSGEGRRTHPRPSSGHLSTSASWRGSRCDVSSRRSWRSSSSC